MLAQLYKTIMTYPSPLNLSYLWNFGVFGLLTLILQIITGLLLSMHYVPNIASAFDSVEHIMRDVNYGWLLRYAHANGASIFFIVIYLHILRGVYYGSYEKPRESLWLSGIIILLLMIITAFLGYILPWGQMSYWGATVITNLVTAIPLIGGKIVIWLWGGFSVANATLNRFYGLHFFLPFILLAVVGLHLLFLHKIGSNNPNGISFKMGSLPFTPYFLIKDLNSLSIYFLFFIYLVCFNPNLLGHPDNYIEANPEITPTHIVPEWYFLPFYAILRSIPDKLGGVLALLMAIIILAIMPYLNIIYKHIIISFRSGKNRNFYEKNFWLLTLIVLILGWIGGKPIEYPYLNLAQIISLLYFLEILIIIPIIKIIENKKNASI